MRIGIDASPLMVRDGGIRRYTENLIRALGRVDHVNEYVLFGAAAAAERIALAPTFEWDRLEYPLKRWFDRIHLIGASRRIDLFHATNYFPPIWNRFPTVLTVHDLSVRLLPEFHPRLRRLRHRQLPGCCHRSARIIADSANTREDLVRHYRVPRSKIDVVHLAVGDRFRRVQDQSELDRVRRRYQLPGSFVLNVGSIDPRKNLDLLVRAMTLLRRRGSRHRLVIAGAGHGGYERMLRQTIREEGLTPSEDVVFTGPVDHEDLPALYSLCDVFAYPSRYEGFGLPPLEAMACGAPVILSSNSSLLEVYRECALMLRDNRPEELAEAIERLLGPGPLHSQLVEAGSKKAESRCWNAVARETVASYQRAGSGLA